MLLADGTHKAIEDVRPKDVVLTTQAGTGKTTSKEVAAAITTEDDKDFTSLTVATDAGLSALVATDTHPFWVPELKDWIKAADLHPGQWIRTSAGTRVQITAVTHHTRRQRPHDLSIEGVHAYYVLAGVTPVLVHNANKCVVVNDAGRYEYLGPGQVGDGLEAHHMTQDGLGFLNRNEGGAIVIEHADHALTRTYKCCALLWLCDA
ncbi:hypothetical protein QR77_33325 [Streptomyces sp. 150FB]|uniref:polymorphic toxin-type HINT domain-containing protein n=1 Tax=Streptomyces sp. 150FB TaxID=1576605 RepID=UPI0005896246|nr:polymorphic toxin-type HINT domain-containing protein [Streptomyces sp. 150FB]KIF77419.1 hypothetical protein QR77_33325 [Streptomyces sp. 150FB]